LRQLSNIQTLVFGIRRKRMLVLASGVFLLAVVGGFGAYRSWWRGRPERLLAEADRALREGDPEAALDALELPERSPATRDRALLVHARAALALKRLPEAVRFLDRVDARGPLATDLAFWKGRALYEAGQSLRAASWFQFVLNRRPGDAEALRWLAAASYDLGDRPTSVASLVALTTLVPGDARAWRTLAVLYKEDVDYERAEAAYAASLKADPAQPRVRFERAESLVPLGRFAEAERELAACRGKVPEADRASLLAQCLWSRGDGDACRVLVESASAAAPQHPGLLVQLAQIDLSEGRAADALARLDRAVQADPYNSQWLYQRGTALLALGRGDEAARDRARAGELNRTLAEMSALNDQAARSPEDPEVRCRLGWLCATLGKTALAASWYRAALACDPHHRGARLGLKTLEAR
jgi:tetratricopeptide (TPR) repeat protein